MVFSLFKAKKLFNGNNDIIISYGDIIFKKKVLKKLIKSKKDVSTVVDTKWYSYWKKRMDNPLNDVESLKLTKNDYITDIGKKVKKLSEINGQYVGLTKISKNMSKKILNIWLSLNKEKNQKFVNNLYMTDFLRILIKSKIKIKAILVKRGWLEFDEPSDLKINF